MSTIDPTRLQFVPFRPLPKTSVLCHRSRLFLKGPIPLPWLCTAAQCSGKALHVALALWFQVGVNRMNRLSLSYRLLREFGVGRHAAYRGLRALEQAGLITVSKGRGRSPIVTLLE